MKKRIKVRRHTRRKKDGSRTIVKKHSRRIRSPLNIEKRYYSELIEPSGIDKLNELGVEILPEWSKNSAYLVIKHRDKEKKIHCIHSVVYKGSVEDMPGTLSTEFIKEKEILPDLETRKFAFRSFTESLVENFPDSLTEEMIGANLSRRIREALNDLNVEGYSDQTLEGLLSDTEGSWEEFRNSYFWTGSGNAASRESYDNRHSWDREIRIRHQTAKTDRTFIIKVDFDVNSSCRNVYVNKSIYINGQKVNINKFKTFCKKIRDGKPIPYSYIR